MGRLWYGLLVMCFVVQAGAAIAETTEERLQRLEQTIEDMKKHEAREREVGGQPPATRSGESPNVQQLGAEGQGAEIQLRRAGQRAAAGTIRHRRGGRSRRGRDGLRRGAAGARASLRGRARS